MPLVVIVTTTVAGTGCSSVQTTTFGSGGSSNSSGGVWTGGAVAPAVGGATAGAAGKSSGGSGQGGAGSSGGASGGSASGGTSRPDSGGGSGGVAVSGGIGAGSQGGSAGVASGGVVGGGGLRAGGAGAGGTSGSSNGGSSAGGAGGSTGVSCDSSGISAYYLDSANGSDAADGKTPATAWQSLAKINAVTMQPGQRLCLRSGSKWTGQLSPKGSGSSTAPVVVDQWGSGARPIIAAGPSDANALYLLNQQYWEINNLELTNKKSTVGDYRGISINGQNGGTLNHIVIRGCFVHDVTGEVNWIGGDTADNAPGITFKTGWDASKKTGGIVFDVQAGSGTAVKTKFNDVVIENNVIQDCSFGGIIFKQLDGSVHWGTRSSASDTTWMPHTNVVVRGNYISQLNTSFGCNGIYLTSVRTGLVEQNVCNGAGTSAIELYYTDSVTVQKNETFGTVRKASGADYNGIDTDKGTTKTIIQYNYVHDNGDGILLCQFSFGDSIVRYNILQNNSRYQIYLHSDAAAQSSIYNNTIYNNKTSSGVAYGYGDSIAATYSFKNNIFFAAAGNGLLTTGGGITYANNLYAGASIQKPASDAAAMTADPKLASPGTGKSGSAAGPAFSSLDGYKLQSGSPAIDKGVTIATGAIVDFWGNSITGTPDIGANELR